MTDSADVAPSSRPIGRRALIASVAATGLGIVFGARTQDALQRVLLPVTLHDPTGFSDLLPVAGRFRIYSVTGDLPQRDAHDYTFSVGGLVDRPTTLTYTDITIALPQTTVKRDFQCVTGWRVHDVEWRGVL